MTKDEHDRICRDLVDQGKLVEAGFVSMQFSVMAKDASPLQVEEMRMAFFAGAQHLFASIMGILEPGAEPTEKDLRRMDLINTELNVFIAQLKAKQHQSGTA